MVSPTNENESQKPASFSIRNQENNLSEKNNKRKQNGSFIHLFSYAKSEKRLICMAMTALAVSSSTNMMIPKVLGKIIDKTSGLSQCQERLSDKTLLVGALCIFACNSLASWARTYCLELASRRIVQKLSTEIFSNLLMQDIQFYDLHHSTELTALLAQDVEYVGDACTNKVSNGIRSASSVFNGSLMLLWISPQLTLVSLGLLPVLGIGAITYFRRIKKKAALQKEFDSRILCFAEERFQQIRTVKAFNQEKWELCKYNEMLNSSTFSANRICSSQAAFMGGISSSTNISLVSLLHVGGSLVSKGKMSVGDLTSFAIYSSLVALGFSGLGSNIAELTKACASSERISILLEEMQMVPVPTGSHLPNEIRGEIIFDNVWFRYPARDQLNIAAGQTIAITGPSGHGKSTLAALLARFYQPTSGRILLDGHDIALLTAKCVRRKIGFVQQNSTLFSGTILENIKYGCPNATLEDVMDAAVAANADEFIKSFTEGYDTYIGQGGRQLSGGQIQRIAISRVLLCNPPIIILDEATSALDAESERQVQKAVDNLLAGGRTLIIIAHRISTIQKASTVAVLKMGQIVETGSYEKLMEKHGEFFHLVNGKNVVQ